MNLSLNKKHKKEEGSFLLLHGRSTTLTLVFLLMISLNAFAQKAIKFSGIIMDANSRSAIVGATVKVSKSNRTLITDVEGRFMLELQTGSKYDLEISSIGYEKKLISDIDPETDNGFTIMLTPSSKSMQEVVVKTSARKETVASLYQMQRNSSGIQDGISAEAIKKSPDKNTGEVLRRVSGTTIQDNKFVVIRGLNERYNVAMLNNNVLPSTEPDKKAFSFDIIPASSIENVIIYKTPMAELPADFTGGLVKVMTKDYPSKKFTEVSVSSTSNTLTTGQTFLGTWYQGNYEPFGFFDKYRSLPDGYVQNRGSSFINLSDAEKQRVSKTFPNSYSYNQLSNSLPTISASISGGNSYILKNNAKIGLLYMIGYGNGRRVSDRNRTDYVLNGDLQYDNNTTVYDRKNNLSGLFNLAYSKGKSKYTLKGLFNNEYSNSLGLRTGYDISNRPETFQYKSYNSEFSANGLLSFVLDGTHSLHKNLNLDWSGSISETYKKQPDQKIVSFRTPIDQPEPYFIKLGNENSPEIRNAGRIFSDLNERIYSFNLNFTYNFKIGDVQQKLKVGTMNFYRDRTTVVDALGYAALDYRGTVIYETGATNYSNIFSPANVDGFKLTLATIGNNSTSYTANAMLNAGYIMWDGKFSEKFKFTAGARAENYKQQLKALNQPDIILPNFDILPSLLFTYKIGAKSNLRLAASESLNRPEFRELASYSVFDYDNFMVIRGNPDLKRSLVKNADLRYEVYPKNGEIFSVSVFYKLFNNPIEQVNLGNDVLSYRNADKATTYGAEIEIRKKLDFIGSGFFEKMIFYSNLSYMLGNVQFGGTQINAPLQGQSPYIINTSLSYATQKDFSLSILYNRIGPRLKFRAVNGAAFNIYEMSRDLIDLQMSQKILKGKAELKLAIIDILAQPFRWYYKFQENPNSNYFDSSKDKYINAFRFGTSFNLGLKVNL